MTDLDTSMGHDHAKAWMELHCRLGGLPAMGHDNADGVLCAALLRLQAQCPEGDQAREATLFTLTVMDTCILYVHGRLGPVPPCPREHTEPSDIWLCQMFQTRSRRDEIGFGALIHQATPVWLSALLLGAAENVRVAVEAGATPRLLGMVN